MDFSTTSAVVAAGGLTVAGQWSEGKPVAPGIIIAGAFVAIGLGVMSEFSPKLGQAMALLIVIAATFRYAVPVLHRVGLTK